MTSWLRDRHYDNVSLSAYIGPVAIEHCHVHCDLSKKDLCKYAFQFNIFIPFNIITPLQYKYRKKI